MRCVNLQGTVWKIKDDSSSAIIIRKLTERIKKLKNNF